MARTNPRFNPPAFPFEHDNSINSDTLRLWLIALTEWAREVDPTLDRLRSEIIPDTLVDAKGDLLVGSEDDLLDRLPVGADNEVLVADSAADLGLAYKGGMVELDRIDAPTGDLTFSNIPGDFRDLLITGTIAHDDASASGVFRASGVRFNGFSSNVYRWFRQQHAGNGTSQSPTSGNAFVNNMQLLRVGSLATAPVTIWIPNYAGTAPHRTAMSDGSGMNSFTNENTTDWLRYVGMGRFASTAAVTSVTITGPGGGDDWDSDTQFTLYGVG